MDQDLSTHAVLVNAVYMLFERRKHAANSPELETPARPIAQIVLCGRRSRTGRIKPLAVTENYFGS